MPEGILSEQKPERFLTDLACRHIEQSAYWLDGALRLGFILHDEALIKQIRARLDPVVEGVAKAPAGTSFSYWKSAYQPQGFDGWAHSQMGRALVALYDATREPRVLEALVKVYAEYPVDMGGPRADFGVASGLRNLDPISHKTPRDFAARIQLRSF